jgi:biotin carboxylase
MMGREFIILLGANQYLRERALAGARKCTNAEVWIADPSAITNKNRYFDGSLPASPYDAENIIKQVLNLDDMELLSVIPLNDWVLETANKVNAHFGLSALSNQTVVRARNKYEMKIRFSENEIPCANHFLLSDDNELPAALEHVGLPAIIKPYDFGGSGGVFVARTLEEAIKYLGESRDVIATHKDAFKIKGDKYLIEEYINSTDEVSVEVICFRGKYKTLTVTEKYLSPEPWFSELGHLVPSFRNNDLELRALAEKTCEALGIEFGMAHVEIKIKDGKFYVIEAAARPGGDGIMDQVEVVFGINPYSLHIGAYLGQDTTTINIPEPTGTAAIAFLKAREGIVKRINEFNEIIKDKNLSSLKISTEVGKKSDSPKNWSTREGVVEFFWPGHLEYEKTLLPLEKANEITEKLFEVE